MTPILHYLILFVRIQNIGVHPDALEWMVENQEPENAGRRDGPIQRRHIRDSNNFFIELYSFHIQITFKFSHYYFYAPELQECSKFAKLANSCSGTEHMFTWRFIFFYQQIIFSHFSSHTFQIPKNKQNNSDYAWNCMNIK